MNIGKVGIIGAGAVGSYFVWGLSGPMKENLYVIAEGERAARLRENGLIINQEHYELNVHGYEDIRDVDLLLIATKYGALEDAAMKIAPFIRPDTMVLSLLNGVDSEEIVGRRIGMEHMLYSMMQIASRRTGNDIWFAPEKTPGVFFGEYPDAGRTDRIDALKELFADTKIRINIPENIMQEIWLKMSFNVSMNLPQAVIGCSISGYVKSEHMKAIRCQLRAEVQAVAAAKGIDISEWSAIEKMEYPSVPDARYSTLQDLDAGRHTEIDMFAGTIMRLGRELGVATPYNEVMYHAIRALEEKQDGVFQ